VAFATQKEQERAENGLESGDLAFFTLKSMRLEQGLLDWKEIVCYAGSLKYG
jgi:hypothetical protein